MFSCDILPKKMFKTQCSGVDKQSVHLEIKCHSGRSEHLDIVLGGRSEGVKTLLGRFKRGCFVKAPVLAASIFSETIGKSEYGLSKSISYYWRLLEYQISDSKLGKLSVIRYQILNIGYKKLSDYRISDIKKKPSSVSRR